MEVIQVIHLSITVSCYYQWNFTSFNRLNYYFTPGNFAWLVFEGLHGHKESEGLPAHVLIIHLLV